MFDGHGDSIGHHILWSSLAYWVCVLCFQSHFRVGERMLERVEWKETGCEIDNLPDAEKNV